MGQDDSEIDLEKSPVQTITDSPTFDDVSPNEIVQCDTELIVVREKGRISLDGPISVIDEVFDFVLENYGDEIDKRYATQSGRRIGEVSVRGDGTLLGCEIDSKYVVE